MKGQKNEKPAKVTPDYGTQTSTGNKPFYLSGTQEMNTLM